MRARSNAAVLEPQFGFMPPRNETERMERAIAAIPDGDEAIIAYVKKLLVRYDRTMRLGDKKMVAALLQAFGDAAIKMNGGTNHGMATENGSLTRLEKALTVEGTVPRWGTPGRFIVQACGCPCLVKYEGVFANWSGFEVAAVYYDRPFISDTGYVSLQERPEELRESWGTGGSAKGKTVDRWIIDELEQPQQWANGRYQKNPKMRPLVAMKEQRVWERGGNGFTLRMPTPPQDDPAWQPGGWIHQWLQDNPPPPLPEPKRERKAKEKGKKAGKAKTRSQPAVMNLMSALRQWPSALKAPS